MNRKTKVIYITIIIALMALILVKPLIEKTGMLGGGKQNSVDISFYEPSIKNLRLLEDMKESKCISGFDYEVTEKKAVIYVTSAQIKKVQSYIQDRVDSIVSGTEDNYEISVNSSFDEFTIQADSNMDFRLILDEYVKIVEACEIYQKCSGQHSWKCRGVIKNRETGAVITDTTQPGENIEYDAVNITGISDVDKAIETVNNNLYTKIDYSEAYVENGVFYSPAGEFKLTLPENADSSYGSELETKNELESGYTLYDLKDRLATGHSVSELEITTDDGTFLGFSANHSVNLYDEKYYDEFVKKEIYDQLKSEYSDAKLEQIDFLDEKCNLITYKADDVTNYMIFRYHKGFSYTIWGKYKNTDGEQFIKDIISSI